MTLKLLFSTASIMGPNGAKTCHIVRTNVKYKPKLKA